MNEETGQKIQGARRPWTTHSQDTCEDWIWRKQSHNKKPIMSPSVMNQNLGLERLNCPTSMAATGWVRLPKLRKSSKCNKWSQMRSFNSHSWSWRGQQGICSCYWERRHQIWPGKIWQWLWFKGSQEDNCAVCMKDYLPCSKWIYWRVHTRFWNPGGTGKDIV